jgi:IMP cyclohydrolase
MANPNGPYPGRQLFVGLTAAQQPCFAYLVTGRSPESRQRQAVQVGNTVRMGPIGDAPYDPLRHYSAVKFDDATGTLAVSNGIQTDAVYETYKLLVNVGSPCDAAYLQQIMEGANAEPDSYHTPRIAACIVPIETGMGYLAAIKAQSGPAAVYPVSPNPGVLAGISVYKGDLARPEATDPGAGLTMLATTATAPNDLATFLFDLSAAEYDGNDIRVCAVAGVWSGSAWELAIVNR